MKLGTLLAVTSCFFFSIYVVLNRYAFTEYEVDQFRYITTFMMSAGVLGLLGVGAEAIKKPLHIERKDIKQLLIATTSATLAAGLLIYGQSVTTAANAGILNSTVVVTTIGFSWLILGEKFGAQKKIWVGILLVGLYFAIVGFSTISLKLGDTLILASSVAFGFANVMSKQLMKVYSSTEVANTRFIFGGAVFGFLAVANSGLSNPLETGAGAFPYLAGLVYWATIMVFYQALKMIGPSKTIVLISLNIVFTIIGAYVFLSEEITANHVAGSAVIVISIYMLNRPSQGSKQVKQNG